jgi:hypothetical protein
MSMDDMKSYQEMQTAKQLPEYDISHRISDGNTVD